MTTIASARPAARPQAVRVRLPLTLLVWLLLVPLAVIVSPIVFVVSFFWRLNPFTAVAVLFGLVIALGGVRIDVEAPGVRVKLF
jgi:hypothetical protein